MERIRVLALYLQQFEYEWGRFEKWYEKKGRAELLEPELDGRSAAVRTPKLGLIVLGARLFVGLGVGELRAVRWAWMVWRPVDWLAKVVLVGLARLKLGLRGDLLVVGITGSYGKTSTKEVLRQLLEKDYKVLAPPGSWNTLVALAWLVLRRLRPGHQVLIVEMGAYRRGEIEGLCRLVEPKVGILTVIGPVHLERFGLMKEIAEAKSELLASLPEGGLAVVNGADRLCVQAAKKSRAPVVWWGADRIAGKIEEVKLGASKVSISSEGVEFEVVSGGARVKLRTDLLGRSAVKNILPAVAVWWWLRSGRGGLDVEVLEKDCEELRRVVRELKPVPHRMEIVRRDGLMTVIDNSYSSNPIAAEESLGVLGEFPGRKIVVTPGFVELGNEQKRANRDFGRKLAKVADYVFVVGDLNRRALLEGLGKGGMAGERVMEFSNREEAARSLAMVAAPGSVVLFENDLPVTYR